MYTILIFTLLIGFLTKFADIIADDGLKIKGSFTYAVGIAYGLLTAYVLVTEPLLAPVIMAAVVSMVAMKKIDKEPHMIGIASLLFIIGFWGFPSINILFMTIFIIAGVLDEIGNDMSDKNKIRGRAKLAFSYMFISEITAFIVSALTGAWIIFIGMIVFDAGYIVTGETGKRLMHKSAKKR